MADPAGTPWRRTPRYERLVTGQRIIEQQADRRCAHPDCGTKLSRYNPDGTCSRHGGWSDTSVVQRGRKPRGGQQRARDRSVPGRLG